MLSTTIVTITQVNHANHVLGILSELVASNPLSYVVYYCLHFINEKIETDRVYMIYTKKSSKEYVSDE